MARVRRVLLLGSISPRVDVALLVLRVWVGMTLFLRHGLEKLFGSSDASSQFPDPLHLGSHFKDNDLNGSRSFRDREPSQLTTSVTAPKRSGLLAQFSLSIDTRISG